MLLNQDQQQNKSGLFPNSCCVYEYYAQACNFKITIRHRKMHGLKNVAQRLWESIDQKITTMPCDTIIYVVLQCFDIHQQQSFRFRITASGISGQLTIVVRKTILQVDNSHQTPELASVCPAVLLIDTHSVSL